MSDSAGAAGATGIPMAEEQQLAGTPAKVDLGSLPVRAYLDQTVVPLLLQGMAQLVKEVREARHLAPRELYLWLNFPPPPLPPPLSTPFTLYASGQQIQSNG